VEQFGAVNHIKRLCDLRDVCQCLHFVERALLLDDSQQRLPLEHLHHHVRGVVFLEERKDLDDVRVLELGQPLTLREKLGFLLQVFRLGDHRARLDRSPVSRTPLNLGEELFDRDCPLQSRVTAKIGDPETSLSQYFSDGIEGALQPRTDGQGGGRPTHGCQR